MDPHVQAILDRRSSLNSREDLSDTWQDALHHFCELSNQVDLDLPLSEPSNTSRPPGQVGWRPRYVIINYKTWAGPKTFNPAAQVSQGINIRPVQNSSAL
jgi:hypothetical protein